MEGARFLYHLPQYLSECISPSPKLIVKPFKGSKSTAGFRTGVNSAHNRTQATQRTERSWTAASAHCGERHQARQPNACASPWTLGVAAQGVGAHSGRAPQLRRKRGQTRQYRRRGVCYDGKCVPAVRAKVTACKGHSLGLPSRSSACVMLVAVQPGPGAGR